MSQCAHSTEKNYCMLSESRIDDLGTDEAGRYTRCKIRTMVLYACSSLGNRRLPYEAYLRDSSKYTGISTFRGRDGYTVMKKMCGCCMVGGMLRQYKELQKPKIKTHLSCLTFDRELQNETVKIFR